MSVMCKYVIKSEIYFVFVSFVRQLKGQSYKR